MGVGKRGPAHLHWPPSPLVCTLGTAEENFPEDTAPGSGVVSNVGLSKLPSSPPPTLLAAQIEQEHTDFPALGGELRELAVEQKRKPHAHPSEAEQCLFVHLCPRTLFCISTEADCVSHRFSGELLCYAGPDNTVARAAG